MPNIFGLLIGESAHQLRAVLDNIAWQLANLDGPPPVPDKVQFPILSKEPAAFASIGAVNGMRPQHVAVLERLQPYKTRKDAEDMTVLEDLAWIDNTDKHRLVHATASLAVDIAPHTLQAYAGHRLLASEFTEGPVVFEGKTQIGRVRISPANPDLQMHVQAAPHFGIAFGEGALYGTWADGYLRILKDTVEKVIVLFDRPGQDGSPPWP